MNNISKRAQILGIITLSLILIAGLVLGIVLKFNTNFELGKYTEFSVVIKTDDKKEINSAIDEVSNIVECNGLKYDTTITSSENGGTKLTVRYQKEADADKIVTVNNDIKEKLNLDSADIKHIHYEGNAGKAILYTSIALAILVVVFSVFSTLRYARYTGLVALISGVLGTALYLSFTIILRLTVGFSYFALLVVLNVFIMYYEISMFEVIDRRANDQESLINNAVISNRKNMTTLAVIIAVISLLFVIVSPTSLKFVSLGLMFIPVVCLIIGLYVAPYFLTVFARATGRVKKN